MSEVTGSADSKCNFHLSVAVVVVQEAAAAATAAAAAAEAERQERLREEYEAAIPDEIKDRVTEALERELVC